MTHAADALPSLSASQERALQALAARGAAVLGTRALPHNLAQQLAGLGLVDLGQEHAGGWARYPDVCLTAAGREYLKPDAGPAADRPATFNGVEPVPPAPDAQLIPLRELAARVGRSYQQLWERATKGLRGVLLETTWDGRLHSSMAAWHRFLAALNPPAGAPTSKPPTPAEIQRRARRASEALKRKGY
jgi:hypothetical protein